jgi:hypothetical protein
LEFRHIHQAQLPISQQHRDAAACCRLLLPAASNERCIKPINWIMPFSDCLESIWEKIDAFHETLFRN